MRRWNASRSPDRLRGCCPAPQAVVALGLLAGGSESAGAIEVAAAARSWERLSAAVRVTWFPARPYPQLLAEPTTRATLAPDRAVMLTFSEPIAGCSGAAGHGSPRPRLAAGGRWMRTRWPSSRAGSASASARRCASSCRWPCTSPGRPGPAHAHPRSGRSRRVRRCGCSSCSPSSATCRSTGSRAPRPRRASPRRSLRPRSRRRRAASPGATPNTPAELRALWRAGPAERDHPRRGDDVRGRRTVLPSTGWPGRRSGRR